MYNFRVFFEKSFVPDVVSRKGVWKVLSSNRDKQEFSPELIGIVQNAYRNTPRGSFVNTVREVLPSDWDSIDFDQDDDIDATIFFRRARSNEAWRGQKIQGIGHDGDRNAIEKILQKLDDILNSNEGWWVEASDALEHVLYKRGVRFIQDEKTLQRIFNDPNLRMIQDRGKYERYIDANTSIRETVFGSPLI